MHHCDVAAGLPGGSKQHSRLTGASGAPAANTRLSPGLSSVLLALFKIQGYSDALRQCTASQFSAVAFPASSKRRAAVPSPAGGTMQVWAADVNSLHAGTPFLCSLEKLAVWGVQCCTPHTQAWPSRDSLPRCCAAVLRGPLPQAVPRRPNAGARHAASSPPNRRKVSSGAPILHVRIIFERDGNCGQLAAGASGTASAGS